jgi:hypothetical protein
MRLSFTSQATIAQIPKPKKWPKLAKTGRFLPNLPLFYRLIRDFKHRKYGNILIKKVVPTPPEGSHPSLIGAADP